MLNILGLAVAYYISGKFGFLFAIAPGYVSPVWPAAGIALAWLLVFGMRAWPGLLLGAIPLNMEFPLGSDLVTSLGQPICIGIGVTLQALFGAELVRRVIGFPNALDRSRDIIWFLLLGGPVSCLVGSLIGVFALVSFGSLEYSSFLYSLWAWWSGDVIGVLVFAPLVFIFAANPRAEWRARKRSVAIPLVVTFALVVLVFNLVMDQEQRRADAEFARRAHIVEERVADTLGDYLQSVRSIEGFFAGSTSVERHEFRTYVRRVIAAAPGIQAFSWNPSVPSTERGAYESAARADGFKDFQFTERDANGQLVTAGMRPEYVPVYYIEPLEGNEAALGFDLASNTARRAALEQARQSGQPVATQLLNLVQGGENRGGILLAVPLYAEDASPVASAQRHGVLRGFVVGAFRLNDMIHAALEKSEIKDISLRISDLGAEPGRQNLYGVLDKDPIAQESQLKALHVTSTIQFGQRLWTLNFTPTPDYAVGQRSSAAWFVLVAGLLFTGLIGAFLLILTGRTLRIERVVAERTKILEDTNVELARINQNLVREITVRKQFESALELSNRELDAFSYSVSHDLRAPLRAINGFSASLAEDFGNVLGEQGKGYLERIRAATLKMGGLIEDLLRLSRVTRSALEPVSLDLSVMVRQILDELRVRDPKRRVEVKLMDGCVAVADRQLLHIALSNLVGNAWKFTRERVDAHIEFGCETQNGESVFFLRDNGAGFDMAYSDKLFRAFQRLHSVSAFEGSGIGLSIAQRIIHRHHGRVWAQSEPNRGATFFFTLPRLE